jgi:hypothetical protein
MQISPGQAKAVFLYFADAAAAYKIIYEILQTGAGFTPESIQAEIDFNTAMLEALGEAFAEPQTTPYRTFAFYSNNRIWL